METTDYGWVKIKFEYIPHNRVCHMGDNTIGNGAATVCYSLKYGSPRYT